MGISINTIDDYNRIIQLVIEHDYHYYVLDDPIISDAEYDTLYKTLEKFEKNNPKLVTVNSPTRKVGEYSNSNLENGIKHQIPMLSLMKSYSQEDDLAYINKLLRVINKDTIRLYLDPKLDGIAVSLVYLDGKLSEASTRGNGYVGLDILNNIKYVSNIPHTLLPPISGKHPRVLEVRGEIVIDKNVFKSLNDSGEITASNARNYVAGLMRRMENTVNQFNGVMFIAYTVPYIDYDIFTHAERMLTVQNYGITINKPFLFAHITTSNISDLELQFKTLEQMKDKLPYDFDGVVIKYDEYYPITTMIYSSKYPLWGIAKKFNLKKILNDKNNGVMK